MSKEEKAIFLDLLEQSQGNELKALELMRYDPKPQIELLDLIYRKKEA